MGTRLRMAASEGSDGEEEISGEKDAAHSL